MQLVKHWRMEDSSAECHRCKTKTLHTLKWCGTREDAYAIWCRNCGNLIVWEYGLPQYCCSVERGDIEPVSQWKKPKMREVKLKDNVRILPNAFNEDE